MTGTPTIVIEEEEEESVHDGDEDAAPERDSETRVARVSRAWSRGLELPPSGLETGIWPPGSRDSSGPRHLQERGVGVCWRWKMARNREGRARLGGGQNGW